MFLGRRRSIVDSRIAGLVALLWLLLQGLTPLTAAELTNGAHFRIVCSDDVSGGGSPNAPSHDSGFCCFAACKTCACANAAFQGDPVPRHIDSSVSIVRLGAEARNIESNCLSLRSARGPPATF